MNPLKKLLGVAPKLQSDGSFSPSTLALKLATNSKTDFDGGVYAAPYKGGRHRVLMVCTEQKNMIMANGKAFSTGNHPVEMSLPMMHLLKAGFEIDVVTPTGKPAKIEMWAMPENDNAVKDLFIDFEEKLGNPGSLAALVEGSLGEESPYIAVFIPGGHGAMLGLPESEDLSKLLKWAHQTNRYTLAICHGPAALLAASLDADKDSFIYRGYKIAAFPDSVDKQTPMIGYMPGQMPWFFGDKLRDLGISIINKKADATCNVDRKLITGASPTAANDFGRLAAETLLKELSNS